MSNTLGIHTSIKHLCDIAQVSRSGYYRYLKTKPLRSDRENNNLIIKDNVLKAFNLKGFKKGSHSIKIILENSFGITYNRKRI